MVQCDAMSASQSFPQRRKRIVKSFGEANVLTDINNDLTNLQITFNIHIHILALPFLDQSWVTNIA